jgi:hypothetical protein
MLERHMINNKQAQYFPKQRQKHQKVELQILDHDQVPIDEVLHPDQVTPDQRVTLITRASIALRCIHYDIEKSLFEHDLTQLDLEPGEAPGTQELLHEDLDWIIKTNQMEISRVMRLISD